MSVFSGDKNLLWTPAACVLLVLCLLQHDTARESVGKWRRCLTGKLEANN